MSLISLHRKYSFVDYQNKLCSFAALFTLCVILISIVLPFVWIFKINNNNFALSDDKIAFEQPMVKFQYKYIFIAEHSYESESKSIICSSFGHLNELTGPENCAKIKIIEHDENYDGIPDEVKFSVEFHTMFRYGVKSISLVIFLDARLNNQCKFRVPSAVIINKKIFPNNFNDRTIVISGSLQPDQQQALVCPFFLRNVKSHFFFEKLNENQTDVDEFKLARIQENLEQNPLHLRFQETATDLKELDTDKTTVKIKLKIPQIAIRYQKTFWQLINDAWINYVAVFAVTFSVANLILNLLFENRWLRARKQNYLKNQEM